ncbi:hypothetical protein Tco_0288969, partial [Tanacetum coccineum]
MSRATIHPPPNSSKFTNTKNAFQTNTSNKNVTNNVTSPVVNNEDLPQLLDSKRGSNVTSWKDMFLVYLDGLEPYLLEILENGPFIPKYPASTPENVLIKPQKQWSSEDKKLVNQDKRLKSSIISCLPNKIMKSVIQCTTAKSMW